MINNIYQHEIETEMPPKADRSNITYATAASSYTTSSGVESARPPSKAVPDMKRISQCT